MSTARLVAVLLFGAALVICLILAVVDAGARNLILACIAANALGGLVLALAGYKVPS